MLNWVLSRAKERSTWIGLTGIATAAGISLNPELTDAIASIGAGIASVVAIVTKDKR